MRKPCNSVSLSEKSSILSSAKTLKQPRSQDCLSSNNKEMCFAHLLTRCARQCFLFAKRFTFIQIQWSHFARTGQKVLHPSSASHTALGSCLLFANSKCVGGCPVPTHPVLLQRRLMQHTLSHRINVLPHGSVILAFYILFKQQNRKHFAIVVRSRIVAECSLAR